MPRHGHARLKGMPVGAQQRIGIVLEGEGADRVRSQHWNRIRKTRSDVQVHQPPVLFGGGSPIFPAQAQVQAESRADAPIVGHKSVGNGFPKILVGVAERDRAGVRHAEQEVRQVAASAGNRRAVSGDLGRRTGEGETAARVLLRQIVELLPAEIAAEGNVVRAVQPEQVGRQGAGLVAIIGGLGIGNPTDAGGKLQARRSPIDRALVVTADAEISRNIHAVGEIRSDT